MTQRISISQAEQNKLINDLFIHVDDFKHWAIRYSERLQLEDDTDHSRNVRMRQVNPKFILRNYMAESAIRSAVDDKDYSEIDRLFTLLKAPFDEQPENERYAGFPPDWAQNISVSCSS